MLFPKMFLSCHAFQGKQKSSAVLNICLTLPNIWVGVGPLKKNFWGHYSNKRCLTKAWSRSYRGLNIWYTGASHKIRIFTKRCVKYCMDALGACKFYCTYFGLYAT